MSGPAGHSDNSSDGVHLEATASGQGTINQAGRDLHIHHGLVRRMDPAATGTEAVCPFPGLASFTSEQAQWFYGRDRLTADLLGRLDERAVHGGPVMVVAASGAGKSSLLRAGLLHQVARGGLPAAGSRHWPQVVFTPGAHPLREAAAALAAALPSDVNGSGEPADPVQEHLDDLLRRLLEARGAQDGRVIMVVDQFEELFTLCESQAERAAFITWLWRAAGADAPGTALALVACGLRADFYAECVSGDPRLRRSLEDGQIVVGPMSVEELRQAITYPAEAVGLQVEPGLADLLLADLRSGRDRQEKPADDQSADYDAGRLPLLAHALRATWIQRHGVTLTHDGYRATGGIEHAIAETAERVFAGLGQGQREARGIFLRLVKIGASPGEDVRRPVARSGLISGSQTEAVIDAFVSSRLLITTRDAVQITHEALLSAWPRLRDWLEEDRAGSLIRQGIEDTATDWERAEGDASLLYRGARLETAGTWESNHSRELTQTAQNFLAASRRAAARTVLVRRSVTAVLAALALVASVLTVIAFQQRADANQAAGRADAAALAAVSGQLAV